VIKNDDDYIELDIKVRINVLVVMVITRGIFFGDLNVYCI